MKKHWKVLIGVVIIGLGIGYYLVSTNQLTVGLSNEKVKMTNGNRIKLTSQQALLMRTDGQVLLDKGKDKRIKPASLAKIMTAILAIELADQYGQDLTKPVLVSGDTNERLLIEGASVAGFQPNVYVTVEEMLYGLMLPSGADAAIALAITTAGSEEVFTDLMNEKAKELEMMDTHFTNSYGTEEANQYATLSDLAKLLLYSLKNETFRTVFTTDYYQDETYSFTSSLFSKFGDPQLKNGRLLGGKTGYTDEAGLCLATLAEVKGQEYILITVGAKGDHTTEQFNMIDARTVYDSL